MPALDPDADRLGKLYSELSRLLQSKLPPGPALMALVDKHGSEDVEWVFGVLSQDMGGVNPQV